MKLSHHAEQILVMYFWFVIIVTTDSVNCSYYYVYLVVYKSGVNLISIIISVN
jgi:hypothetical protein